MSGHAQSCPNCGSDHLTDNGGADNHALTHGMHGIVHGMQHASPLFLGLGALGLAMRVLNPKKYTCLRCGYVFKA